MHYKVNKTPTRTEDGEKLYRIKASRDFRIMGEEIKKGTVGGLIGKYTKLLNNAWVDESSIVSRGKINASFINHNSNVKGDPDPILIIGSFIYNSNIYMSRISDAYVYSCNIKESEYIGLNIKNSIIENSFVYNFSREMDNVFIKNSDIHNCEMINVNIEESKLMASWFKNASILSHNGIELRLDDGGIKGGYSVGGEIHNCEEIIKRNFTGPLNSNK